jgi:hypothetical protein
MLSLMTRAPLSERPLLEDRVRDAVTALQTRQATSRRKRSVWARGAGLHVLLGLYGEEAFARLTPLGGSQFGLAFRSRGAEGMWEPLLFAGDLEEVVEHALVAEDALPA